MTRFERVREARSNPPSPEQVREKAAEGWHIVAVEWARPVDSSSGDAGLLKEEIPYGLRVSADCKHLEESPEEKEAMVLMLELIVEDKPFSQVAEGLNGQGLRTRSGSPWSQVAVFNMLPRLIQVAPQIFASAEWSDRRKDVTKRLQALLG
jgi:hypothetical protein